MKITYLSASTLPSCSANSINVMKMCNAFVAHGHEVNLFAYKGDSTRDVYNYYGVSPGFVIREIRNSAIPGVRRILRAAGGADIRRGHTLPDLIYGRELYSMLSASRSGTPMIYESHVLPRSYLERHLTGRLLGSPNLRRLVVISGVLARDYLALYPWFDPQRLMIAHDGADVPGPNRSVGKLTWPGRPTAVQAGYVGSLYPGKGADIVVAMAQKLPGIDFHIVGGKPGEIEQLRAGFHGTNLHMHGYVEHGEIANYLACLDIALLPAQEHVYVSRTMDIGRWMSPLKLFEYMAARLPIVASRLPVIEEILKQNVNALLVAPQDLECWTETVDLLARDRALRGVLANKAYVELTESYTWLARSRRVVTDIVG